MQYVCVIAHAVFFMHIWETGKPERVVRIHCMFSVRVFSYFAISSRIVFINTINIEKFGRC